MIHALVSLLLAVPLVVMRPYAIGAANTDEQTFVLLVSAGYFIYDFVAVTYVELTHKKYGLVPNNRLPLLEWSSHVLCGLWCGRMCGWMCVW